MAAPTFVGESTPTAGGAATVTVDLSGIDIQADDLLIGHILSASGTDGVLTIPTDWTERTPIAGLTTSQHTSWVTTKELATGSETSIQFDMPGSTGSGTAAAVTCWRGADTTTPVNQFDEVALGATGRRGQTARPRRSGAIVSLRLGPTAPGRGP